MMQRKKDHNGSKLLLSFILIIVGLILLLNSSSNSLVNAQQNKDCPSYRSQSYFPRMRYENDGTVTRSEYLTMRDGVKIACDLYLPYRAVNENHRLPTLLHITRYFRSYKVNWPFNYLLGDKISINGIPFPKFLARGYAIVSCDTRGSGVSFGKRLYDFHRDEVQDFKEVLDWITKQKFSNGKIVASGISYDGMVTDFLTSLNHPALVAVSSVSGPFDIYRDTIYPGGIYQKSFIDYYLKFTQIVESGKMITRSDLCLGCAPETLKEKILDKLAKLLLGGVQPVDDNDLETMRKAIESHKDSTDMLDVVHHLEKGINKIVTTDKFTYEMERDGPMRVIADNKKRIPMLVFGGYYESMVLNSVVKRFYSLYHKDSKLFMGPYNHGLKVMNSPYAENNSPCFDAFEEVMRFFDHHLGLEENLGLENEKQVHYYSVGAEKWFSVDSWPPKSEEQVWHLTNAGALVSEKSELNQVLKLDMEQETLIDSKWNMLTSLFQKATKYPATLSSPEFSNGKLNYISQPLSEDLDVTGYPHLTVEVSANNRDGLIFAYLQEVDAKGTVNFIMDTQLRLVHRKLNTHRNTSGLIDVVPHHTFYLEDRQYLEPNQKTSVQLYFPAVSYTVKKGHSLKLTLFSFDKINFKIFENESDLSSELLLHTASIHLPIVHARRPEFSSSSPPTDHSKDEL